MAYEFKFPDVGEGVTEGTIIKWKVKEGDKVEADQPLAEVETDKAIVEPPSPKKGTILKLNHKEGEIIKVGEVLAVIGEKGEKVKEKSYTGSVVGFLEEAPEEGKKSKSSGKEEPGVLAAPLARKLAKELNIDLAKIKGTGPGGRITADDVKKSGTGTVKKGLKITKKYDFFGYVDRIPLKGIRKITAEKMTEAVRNAALVTHHDHVDVTLLSDGRKSEKEKEAKKLFDKYAVSQI